MSSGIVDPLEKKERLCDLALQLPQEAWPDLLDVACEDEPELRRKISSLLDSLGSDVDFLASPLASPGGFHGDSELVLADRGPTDRGPTDRGPTDRGPTDRGTANRGPANRGPTDHADLKQIGGYQIDRILGHGGMAVVYEARQRYPNRSIALKVLYPGPITPSLERRFRRESELMGRLQHPGIVHIFEAGFEDVPEPEGSFQRLPFIAMERVPGICLNRYLTQSPLSLKTRLKLFTKICDAVGYAHQQGVLHRDLKPSNILIDKDGRAKIIDFGIGRYLSRDADPFGSLTADGQILGSLAYMSPEQLVGKNDCVNERSDGYSLGVLLYEMLTSSRPFEVQHLSPPEAVAVITGTAPASVKACDPVHGKELQKIVSRAMAKDQAHRYSSARELADDILRIFRPTRFSRQQGLSDN